MATRREQIEQLIREDWKSANELAKQLDVPLKEIEEDLKHIRLSNKGSFKIKPAVCKDCNFVFSKEGKTTKPSKCPNCNGERIIAPLFRIENAK